MTTKELINYLRNAARAIDEYYPDLSSIRDQVESDRLREAAAELERLIEISKTPPPI